MAAPLGTLLSDTWSFFQKHIAAIAVVAVALAVLQIVLQLTVFASVAPVAMDMFKGMGMDQGKMVELQQRMAAGDESAMQEFQAEMERVNRDPSVQKMMGMNMLTFFRDAGPTIALSMLVSFLISFAGCVYYFFVALEGKDFQGALKRTGEYLFPLLGLTIWVFLRSFLWIPFLGIILAFIFYPRFILSNIILVKEGKGITQSASESYRRTEGLWGKIVGNFLVATLCVWIATVLIMIVVGMFGSGAKFFVHPFVSQVTLAFLVIFKTKLALSILGGRKA